MSKSDGDVASAVALASIACMVFGFFIGWLVFERSFQTNRVCEYLLQQRADTVLVIQQNPICADVVLRGGNQ